ncbi:MAG: hypothetical protein R3A79_14295 [Nannocystaceae bacterium]
MTRPWKTLLLSVAVFQVALSFAFWRMIDYVQWLHFNATTAGYEGFMDTGPGRKMGTLLLAVAGILLVVNLVVAGRAGATTPAPQPR